MAVSERYAKDFDKSISDFNKSMSGNAFAVVKEKPWKKNAILNDKIRRGQTEEAAQIMTDNTGKQYEYYKLPKDQPTGLKTVGITQGEMLENTGVPRMTIAEGGRELDPLEVNKAYYAYYHPKGAKDAFLPGFNPNIAPYDREKKWLIYNGSTPIGAYVTNKLVVLKWSRDLLLLLLLY